MLIDPRDHARIERVREEVNRWIDFLAAQPGGLEKLEAFTELIMKGVTPIGAVAGDVSQLLEHGRSIVRLFKK